MKFLKIVMPSGKHRAVAYSSMEDKPALYRLAAGEVTLWYDGCVQIKTRNPHNDPVELSDEEALELARILKELVQTA